MIIYLFRIILYILFLGIEKVTYGLEAILEGWIIFWWKALISEITIPKVDQNSIKGYKVREFVNDKEGNLWIATEDNGLNYFNTKTKQFTHISENSKPLSVTFPNIQSLNLVDDKLWVGTFSKGFDVLDLKTGRSKHYEKKDNDSTTIQNNHILAIYTDRNGITWIGLQVIYIHMFQRLMV